MLPSSHADRPSCMTISDLARLWSEEAGQSASKIQQDLEMWLATRQSGSVKGEAQATEEKSVSDDLLTLLTGHRYIERDACEAYCRERGLNMPEFWFSDTGPPTEGFSAESERSDDEAVRCAGLLTLLCGAETKSSLQPEMPEPLAVPPEEKKSETVVSLISENSSYITQELESPFTPVVDRARGVLEILLLPLARRPLTTAVAAATVLSIAVVGSQQWLEVGNDEYVEARLLEHAQERTPDKNPIMGLSGAQGIDQERVEATLGAVQLPNSQMGSSPAPALERATTVSTLEADPTPIPSSKGTVLRSFSEKPDGLRSVGPEEVTNDAVEPVIVESMSPGRIDPERTDRETVTAYQFSPRPQSSARRQASLLLVPGLYLAPQIDPSSGFYPASFLGHVLKVLPRHIRHSRPRATAANRLPQLRGQWQQQLPSLGAFAPMVGAVSLARPESCRRRE